MYISINSASQFADVFAQYGREDQFSYDALKALYEHLEECDYQELDVIGLCCEFTEYPTALECMQDRYSSDYENVLDFEEFDNDDDKEKKALEYLQDRTLVIEFDGGILVSEF